MIIPVSPPAATNLEGWPVVIRRHPIRLVRSFVRIDRKTHHPISATHFASLPVNDSQRANTTLP